MATFHLIIEPSAGGRYEHRLAAGIYVLGREQESCDLAIASPEISRRHVRLTLSETQCTVEDLGSTSGTYRGGETVRESRAFAYPVELHLGTVRLAITLANQSADQTNGSGIAGHYTKGAEIAKGGMGAVLEANDQLLGRTVAMKVVRHDIGDSESIRLRFIREATVLARLEHPSIVPIYEMGKDAEGRLYYTMKKVEGRTLQAILDDLQAGKAGTVKEYTLDRLLNIYRKICDAMAFAHDRGVIHRDLKPENVMVGEYGEVLVMDWGLAKILQDAAQSAVEQQLSTQVPGSASGTQIPTGFQELSDSQLSGSSQNLTLDGAVMGSPQYMPPEQAEGKVTEVDERSDIFSLGGILYAILTLKPPVEGRTIKEVLDNVKNGRITPPTHYNTGSSTAQGEKLAQGTIKDPKLITPLPHCPGGRVPSALSSVTMKAMAFAPANRYAEVEELARDVEAYQQGFATSAENISAMGQVMLLVKRHKGASIATGAAAVLILLLSVFYVVRLNESKQAAIDAGQEALKQRDEAERLQKETRTALARASLSLAEAALREADGSGMQIALAEVPKDLRNPTWNYLMNESDSSITRIQTSTNALESVAADPTRPGVFAVTDHNHKVSLINVRTGVGLLEFPAGFSNTLDSHGYRIAFSPDGRQIAIGRDGLGGIVIHDARTGAKLREWDAPESNYIEFGRENRLLQGNGSNLSVWDASTGIKLWEISRQKAGAPIHGIFAPGGLEAIVFSSKNGLQVVDGKDGTVIKTLGGRRASYGWSMAARPDGKVLFTCNESGIVECIRLDDGKKLFELPSKIKSYLMGFTADGSQLVTVAKMNNGDQAIEVWNAETGSRLRNLLGGSGQPVGLSIHPLSNELVISGLNTRAWDLTGPPDRWGFQANKVFYTSNISFWGAEDLAFGLPTASEQWGLYRLPPNSMEKIWGPEGNAQYVSATSADGRVAAISKPGSMTDTIVLQKQGDRVISTNIFDVGFWPYRLRISHSGDRLALMERPQFPKIKVLDTSSGKVAFDPQRDGIKAFNDLAWLEGNRLIGLVTTDAKRGEPGSIEKILVWDEVEGKVLLDATHSTALDVIAVAPDGKRFAEAGADKLVRIRDTKTLEIQAEFRAHDAGITSLAWHPTQPILATGSADLSVKLWNLNDLRCTTEFRGNMSSPYDLAFSPSGLRLAAVYFDEQVARIWELATSGETSIWTWQNAPFKNPQLTANDLIGRYALDKVENQWHAGEIRALPGQPDKLEWRNDSGIVWGLTIFPKGILETDERNPYREGFSSFKVVTGDSSSGKVIGFRFQTGFFRKQDK